MQSSDSTNKIPESVKTSSDKNAPNPEISPLPDDNVDQDGHCIRPAYGESVGPDSGAPCDDGRAG